MPGKPYHHGDLRNRLITVTRGVVEDEGAETVTLARIAKACEVSVAAPYRHFPGKEALLGAVAAEGFIELRAALTGVDATPDARERLVAAGVAYVDYAVGHPHLFRLMFSTQLRERQSEVGPATLAALAALVEPLDLRVPIDVAVRTAWALAHGLATLRLGGMLAFTRDDSERRLRDEFGALLTGIVPGAPEHTPAA